MNLKALILMNLWGWCILAPIIVGMVTWYGSWLAGLALGPIIVGMWFVIIPEAIRDWNDE